MTAHNSGLWGQHLHPSGQLLAKPLIPRCYSINGLAGYSIKAQASAATGPPQVPHTTSSHRSCSTIHLNQSAAGQAANPTLLQHQWSGGLQHQSSGIRSKWTTSGALQIQITALKAQVICTVRRQGAEPTLLQHQQPGRLQHQSLGNRSDWTTS